MTGTAIGDQVETIACQLCGSLLVLKAEQDLPYEWVQVVLPCTTVYFCPRELAQHGGSRAALKHGANTYHAQKGGCPGCRVTP